MKNINIYIYIFENKDDSKYKRCVTGALQELHHCKRQTNRSHSGHSEEMRKLLDQYSCDYIPSRSKSRTRIVIYVSITCIYHVQLVFNSIDAGRIY